MSWNAKMEKPDSEASCFNITTDRVKNEKWPTVSLYLHELPPWRNRHEKMEKPVTATSCFNTTTDRVKIEKWLTVSLYLNELLGWKWWIQRSGRRIKITTKGIPRRVHATVTNPAWVTHLLRTAVANSVVECILRAKTQTIRWRDEYTYNHSRRWPCKTTAIKYMPPLQLRLICAQGRDYI